MISRAIHISGMTFTFNILKIRIEMRMIEMDNEVSYLISIRPAIAFEGIVVNGDM